MNLSAELAFDREQAVDEAKRRDVKLMVLLGCLSVIGVAVNSLLLDVYLHTRRKVLSTYFISALAAIDLVISAVVMPLRMMLVMTAVPPAVCGLCMSICYACVGVSIMLFFCITFDRYQSVCLLQKPLITKQKLHFVVAWGFVSAVYAGIMAPLYLQGEITVLDTRGNVSGNYSSGEPYQRVTFLMRQGYPCYTTSMLSHSSRVWDIRYIVQLVFAVCCGSLVLFALVLYFFIFLTLRQQDQFRLQSMSSRQQKPAPRELTARPCFNLDSQAAIPLGYMPERTNADAEEQAPYASSGTSKNDWVVDNSQKCDAPKRDLQKEKCGPSNFNANNQSQVQVTESPNKEEKTKNCDRNRGNSPAEISSVSSSPLHSIDLFKFRRRLNGKVEPLPEYSGVQVKVNCAVGNLPDNGNNSDPDNKNIHKHSPRIGLKHNENNQGIRIYKNSIFTTTLSCFRGHSSHLELEKQVSDNFCSQFESSTDSFCSNKEESHSHRESSGHQERKAHVATETGEDPVHCGKGSWTLETLQLADTSFRPRSLSCPASERPTKKRRNKKLGNEPAFRRNMKTITGNAEESSGEQESAELEIHLKNRSTASFREVGVNTGGLYSNQLKLQNAMIVRTSLKKSCSLSFQTLSKSSSTTNDQPMNGSCSANSSSEINANATSKLDLPALTTITVKKQSFQNSEDAKNSLHSARVEGKQLHVNTAEVRVCSTGTANILDAEKSPISDTKHHATSFWENFSLQVQWSLSTRVTARLCLLTVTYCLWWMPYYVTELGLVGYQELMPEIFFVANVMNPMLHIVTSQIFRRQAKTRLKVYFSILATKCCPKTSKK